ncbi:MAG: hypothetical protein U0807_18750 [Candidatus Binatia bacterium]
MADRAPDASRRRLTTGLALALLLMAAGTAGAGGKSCGRTCAVAQRACLRDARGGFGRHRADCLGDPASGRVCRVRAKHLFATARKVCRSFRRQCQQCCHTHGPRCDTPPELPVVIGSFPFPDRRALEHTGLPPAPDGHGFVALALPDGLVGFDPAARTPVSAAAECATAVLACFAPPARNWAGCLAAVPECETRTPWVGDHPMCCPADCSERYQARRREGLTGPQAFAAAIWEAPSCMPALRGAGPARREP